MISVYSPYSIDIILSLNHQATSTEKMKKVKSLAINIGVAIATFIVLFIITECALRFYAGITTLYAHAYSKAQPSPDVCGFYEFSQNRLSGIFQLAENPNLGVELKPGAIADSGLGNKFGRLLYKINSQGLREDREYAIPKPADVVRIAAIGDSVTFGWGIDLVGSYPKILERKLQQFTNNSGSNKKVEVMNFGIPGYNGEQKFLLLKEKVLAYEPDQVIMGWLVDDGGKPAYLTGIPFVPKFIYTFLNEHSYLFSCFREQLIKKVYELNAKPYKERYREGAESWGETKKVFKKISDFSKEKHVPVLMVFLPVWQLYDQNQKEGIIDIHAFLEKTAEENNLASLDTLPKIADITIINITTPSGYVAARGDLYHPGYKGHEIIADAIYAIITEEKAPRDMNVVIAR